MIVVSFWSPKGGVGKTTLALNVAAAAALKGLKVVVSDLDPQQSAFDVSRENNLPFTVVSGLPQVKIRSDLLILDHQPTREFSHRSDIIVAPIRPCILDIRSLTKAIRNVQVPRLIRCANAVDARRQEERKVSLALYAQGAKLVKDRSVYPKSVGRGKTVFDKEFYKGNAEARAEILRLLGAILD